MANLQAATVSDSAEVTDEEAVKELFDDYRVSVDWKITDDGELQFHGYHALYIRPSEDEMGDTHLATEQFFAKLTEYIEEGEELDIMEAGYTKLRFPVHAIRWIVKPDGVYKDSLNSPEKVVETGA
jgi:hypothetical protein